MSEQAHKRKSAPDLMRSNKGNQTSVKVVLQIHGGLYIVVTEISNCQFLLVHNTIVTTE